MLKIKVNKFLQLVEFCCAEVFGGEKLNLYFFVVHILIIEDLSFIGFKLNYIIA